MYHLEPMGLVQDGAEPRAFNIMLEHEIVGEVHRRCQDWELTLGAYGQTFAMLYEVQKYLDEFKGG